MKPTSIIHRLVILLITLMSAIGANAAEAYACYTSSNTTLTFYYDNYRNSHTNTYSLNTGNVEPGWLSSNVTKVVFDSSFAGARPKSTFSWFSGMTNLESIEGMSYLNTTQVTDMRWMFYNCSKLTSLDLSHFDTSVVDYMARMFSGCSNLTILDLSSFNTSLVDEMGNMFSECRTLETIYVGSGWNVDGVISSGGMFFRCYKLKGGQRTPYQSSNPTDKTYAHIDGGTSNPGYLTDINSPMPYACYTPENTTLTFYYDKQRSSRSGTTYFLNSGSNNPGWYISETYKNVTKVVFDPSFAEARPTTTYGWFNNMYNLESFEGMFYLNTSEVTDMSWMFANCSKLTSLDLGSFNTSKVTEMYKMFYGCINIRNIYVASRWSTDAVTTSTDMFSLCYKLVGCRGTTYDASHVDKTYARKDGGSDNPGYFDIGHEAYARLYNDDTLIFCYDSTRGYGSNTYDLNTGSNNPGWFEDGACRNVTRVEFHDSFAEVRPTSTYGWYKNMTNLETIEGVQYLNTSEVTNMAWMFYNCYALASIDLRFFDTSKVKTMDGMFYECLNLQTIYVSSRWTTNAVTSSDDMFYNCIKLKGEQDTSYDKNHNDAAYAHLDGGSNNPGYFTAMGKEAYAYYDYDEGTLTFYYDKLRSSRNGTTFDLNEMYWPDWYEYSIYEVTFDPSFAEARPKSTNAWFCYKDIANINGIEYLNTSEVTNMAWMFFNCSNLTSLDVSHFNTSNVTSMTRMFGACEGLESLDLSSFNTSKVTSMEEMFSYCTNLQTIYVGSGWSTAGVTRSEDMFINSLSLEGGKGTTYDDNHVDKTYAHIDGGTSNPGYFTEKPIEAYACYTPSNTTLTFYYDNLRTSREGTTYNLNKVNNNPDWRSDDNIAYLTKVVFDPSFADARPTTTYDWFYGIHSLRSIVGMNYLNTSRVTNMSWMFGYCSNLTNLDLSSFNTSKVTTMDGMFCDCLNLQTIYVGDGWSTAGGPSSYHMFDDCTHLKGGQGTIWNSSNPTDKTYARIDGGSSNPGYFTYKKPSAIATDLNQVTSDKSQVISDEWYTIDGRKLNGKPAAKGIYIQNGQKRIIK